MVSNYHDKPKCFSVPIKIKTKQYHYKIHFNMIDTANDALL